MTFVAHHIPYRLTDSFSKLVNDYLQGSSLEGFYQYKPSEEEVLKAIEGRKTFDCDRKALVDHLIKSFGDVEISELTQKHVRDLLSPDTFTVCTAHQPNIFTGHLYFIYKILHVIRLAAHLNQSHPSFRFVPVFYMGSEDADLEELGSFEVKGKPYRWATSQTGAVGRMICDGTLLSLIDELEGQLSVEPHGKELIDLLRDCYREGDRIERCTFRLLNRLFGQYGLVIFLPDSPATKTMFAKEMSAELKDAVSSTQLRATLERFPSAYKVQAEGRDINLFYLHDHSRERIEPFENGAVRLSESGRVLQREEWERELKEHPERFSPNVILRPVFQEKVLPNIIFVGGGSELAYWLELKEVFAAFDVHYPMLLLRNSYQLMDARSIHILKKLRLQLTDIFLLEKELMEKVVRSHAIERLDLEDEKQKLRDLYHAIRLQSSRTDASLETHVLALEKKSLDKIEALEKKILRAAKRRHAEELGQLSVLMQNMKPGGSLQERVDNILPFYAIYGKCIIETLFKNSLAFEQEFCLLTEE